METVEPATTLQMFELMKEQYPINDIYDFPNFLRSYADNLEKRLKEELAQAHEEMEAAQGA
jgi:hypothetical protein